MKDQLSARAILWGVLRDGLIAGTLIAIPIIALMWGTAAL